MRKFALMLVFLIFCYPSTGFAEKTWNVIQLEKLVHAANAEFGLPKNLLLAIAYAESYSPTHGHPWPWTLRIGQYSVYFKSAKIAESVLNSDKFSDINKNLVDIGLFQINLHYHGHSVKYESNKLIQPKTNARLAARLLSRLRIQAGNWDDAVAAYNAGPRRVNSRRGRRYVKRVNSYLKLISSGIIRQ